MEDTFNVLVDLGLDCGFSIEDAMKMARETLILEAEAESEDMSDIDSYF